MSYRLCVGASRSGVCPGRSLAPSTAEALRENVTLGSKTGNLRVSGTTAPVSREIEGFR